METCLSDLWRIVQKFSKGSDFSPKFWKKLSKEVMGRGSQVNKKEKSEMLEITWLTCRLFLSGVIKSQSTIEMACKMFNRKSQVITELWKDEEGFPDFRTSECHRICMTLIPVISGEAALRQLSLGGIIFPIKSLSVCEFHTPDSLCQRNLATFCCTPPSPSFPSTLHWQFLNWNTAGNDVWEVRSHPCVREEGLRTSGRMIWGDDRQHPKQSKGVLGWAREEVEKWSPEPST